MLLVDDGHSDLVALLLGRSNTVKMVTVLSLEDILQLEMLLEGHSLRKL